MNQWTIMLKCKECGNFPKVLPGARKKKDIFCNCKPDAHFETPESWNEAQSKEQV